MDYNKARENNRKLWDEFPIMYAFNEKQLREVYKSFNVDSMDDLTSTPNGGIIKKSDLKAYNDLVKTINENTEKYKKDDEYMFTGFLTELSENEYSYTRDITQTLSRFDLTNADVLLDPRLFDLLLKAKSQYFDLIQ